MNCETVLETYLALDRYDALPFAVKIHCLRCKKCSRLIYKMHYCINLHQEEMQRPLSFDDPLLCTAMQNIGTLQQQEQPFNYESSRSFYAWLIVGILLITGFVILPLSEIGQSGMDQFGSYFNISFALLCAGSVIGYSAMFLVRNITFFNKKLYY